MLSPSHLTQSQQFLHSILTNIQGTPMHMSFAHILLQQRQNKQSFSFGHSNTIYKIATDALVHTKLKFQSPVSVAPPTIVSAATFEIF
jgi:hypothetical protein